MPNWCYTSYVAEGPKEQLQKLYDTMLSLAAMPPPGLLKNDFGSAWLGNLVMALGLNPYEQNNFRCRGDYSNVELQPNGNLTFDTTTAWCEADDTRRLIEAKFPGVRLFYISEEFGCCYWETNDIDGKYFTERYYYRNEEDDDADGPYYSSLEELLDYIQETTGLTGMSTLEECEEALNNYYKDDCSFALYHISFDTSNK